MSRLRDFDGDGIGDLLFSNGQSYATWLDSSYNTPLVNGYTSSSVVASADFNADGETDLVLRDPDTGALVLWSGGLSSQERPLGAIAVSASVVAGDFDGDGRQDLVVADQYGTGKVELWSHGDSSQSRTLGYIGFDGEHWQLAAGDFDGDGVDDLFFRLAVPLQRHSAPPSPVAVWLSGDYHRGKYLGQVDGFNNGLIIGDFDGDGKADIYYTRPQDVSQSFEGVYKWNGGSVESATKLGGPAGATSGVVRNAGDLNGDGRDDLIFATMTLGSNAFYDLTVWDSGSPSGAHTLPFVLASNWSVTP